MRLQVIKTLEGASILWKELKKRLGYEKWSRMRESRPVSKLKK